MPLRHCLLAVAVAIVWGFNFVVIKSGVGEVPPLMLSGLRFFFAAVPAVLFLKPPKARRAIVVAYGLTVGVMQFGLLFVAIGIGMPPGLASLVMQIQAFFTVAVAALVFGERPSWVQMTGAAVAFVGIAVIGAGLGSGKLGNTLVLPFLLVVAASLSWGIANVVGKSAGPIDALSFIVWSSLAVPLPLLMLSCLFEGAPAFAALAHPSSLLVADVAFLSFGATLFGFGAWSWLLARYDAAVVAPFSLLVPIAGFLSAYLVYGEPVSLWEIFGGILILAGLAFNLSGGARRSPLSSSHSHA
jgi:O-acetylserine/cysteine efflux transporter